MAQFAAAGDILRDAAVELGLINTSALTNPYSSPDPNLILLTRTLNKMGRRIIKDEVWSWLTNTWILNTNDIANSTPAAHPLPEDFLDFVPSTYWNLSSKLPVGGPMSMQQWSTLVASLAGLTLTILWKPANYTATTGTLNEARGSNPLFPVGRAVQFYPTVRSQVPANQQLSIEYKIRTWVSPVDSVEASKDGATAVDDVVWLDGELMVAAVRYGYEKARGYDVTQSKADFDELLTLARQTNTPRQRLTLNSDDTTVPILGPQNIPITGYGG